MTAIVRLNIFADWTSPKVRRVLEVPFDIPLVDLHRVIQTSFDAPWNGAFDFRARGIAWSNAQDVPGLSNDVADVASATLRKASFHLTSVSVLHHSPLSSAREYNTIRVGAQKAAEPGATYPRLIAAEGRLQAGRHGAEIPKAEIVRLSVALLNPDQRLAPAA